MILLELISKLSQTVQRKFLQPQNKQSFSYLFFSLYATMISLIFSLPLAFAAEVRLAWDANDKASGYNVYYGTKSNNYEIKIDAGNNLKFTASNLIENQVYYFAVTAYNDNGESEFSTEVSSLVTPIKDPLNIENLKSDILNFNDFVVESYDKSQDQNPIVTLADNGATLRLWGNGWKKIYFPYTVTANTVIEFDFKSTVRGEVHGIGFDDDDSINNPIRTFQLYGTQSWGIPDFKDYQSSAPNWKHYRIPVGQFYKGDMLYLTFTNDYDSNTQTAESYFSNIRVYE